KIGDFGNGERDVLAAGARGGLPQIHEAIAVAIGQWAEHDTANDAEDRGVRADPEAEREDHRESKAARPRQAAQGKANIREEHWAIPRKSLQWRRSDRRGGAPKAEAILI